MLYLVKLCGTVHFSVAPVGTYACCIESHRIALTAYNYQKNDSSETRSVTKEVH